MKKEFEIDDILNAVNSISKMERKKDENIEIKNDSAGKVDVLTLPIEPNLIEQTSHDKAINLALTGGDDYELCFTVSEKHENQLLEELTSEFDTLFTCVGQITESKELLIAGNEGYALPESTFEHFSS